MLSRYGEHPLHGVDPVAAAKQVRGLAERDHDPMSMAIFEQQAKALGHLFTVAANFTDPDAFFVGGGVVEASPWFRTWFLDTVGANTTLRAEQAERTERSFATSTWPAPAAPPSPPSAPSADRHPIPAAFWSRTLAGSASMRDQNRYG